MKNWRPVVLLCTDYKLMSKVFATRLKGGDEAAHPCDSDLLCSWQVGHRQHPYNARLILLAQEKAFDWVEHLHLWKLPECFFSDQVS